MPGRRSIAASDGRAAAAMADFAEIKGWIVRGLSLDVSEQTHDTGFGLVVVPVSVLLSFQALRQGRGRGRGPDPVQPTETNSISKVRSLPASGWFASSVTTVSVTSATVTGIARPSGVRICSWVPGSSGISAGICSRGTS